MLLPQVLLALATTAVVAFQMLVIYFLRISALGEFCEGLAISFALASSREVMGKVGNAYSKNECNVAFSEGVDTRKHDSRFTIHTDSHSSHSDRAMLSRALQ